MADTAHSGNASFHPSKSGHWQDFAWQGFIADCLSPAEMVSGSTTNSRQVHRNRAAAGALLWPGALTSGCAPQRNPTLTIKVRFGPEESRHIGPGRRRTQSPRFSLSESEHLVGAPPIITGQLYQQLWPNFRSCFNFVRGWMCPLGTSAETMAACRPR